MSNWGPGIDQLPSGKYRARVHVGDGKYKTKSFTRLRDAQKWRESTQVAKETGRIDSTDADLQTLGALAAEHMAAERDRLASKTYDVYRNLWRTHVHSTTLAALPLRSVTPATIETWRDERLDAGAGRESIRKTMALMQTVLDRARRFDRLGGRENPVKLVRKPKAAAKTASAVRVGPEQVEAMRSRLKGADAVLMSVLAYTGMRPGEARGLRWGDVGKRTVRVERAADADGSMKPTKTEHMRTVPLIKPLAEELADWRTVCGSPSDDRFVFERADRGAWTEQDYRNWRTRKFGRAAKDAGVPIGRPYDLRHSAASLWLMERVTPVQVAAWMGHRPQELYDTYAGVIADLDPRKRVDAGKLVGKVRRDRPVTWVDRHGGSSQGKPTTTPKANKSSVHAGSWRPAKVTA